MHQAIAVTIWNSVVLAVLSPAAAQAASDGDWGGAFGMIAGQGLLFVVLHAIVFFPSRWLLGPRGVRSFAQSRLNDVALGLSPLSLAGTLGRRAAGA